MKLSSKPGSRFSSTISGEPGAAERSVADNVDLGRFDAGKKPAADRIRKIEVQPEPARHVDTPDIRRRNSDVPQQYENSRGDRGLRLHEVRHVAFGDH